MMLGATKKVCCLFSFVNLFFLKKHLLQYEVLVHHTFRLISLHMLPIIAIPFFWFHLCFTGHCEKNISFFLFPFFFFNAIVPADDFVGITNKQSYLFLCNLLLFRSQPWPSSFRFLFANSHSSLLSRSLLRLVLVLVVVRPLFPRGGCGGVRTLRRVTRREELRGRGRVRQHHTPEGQGEGGWGGTGRERE